MIVKTRRLYSLTLGKHRYSETDDEMREVLRRHNTVLDALARPGGALQPRHDPEVYSKTLDLTP